jgi:hypothetical protein
VTALELVAHDVPRADRGPAPPACRTGSVREHLLEALAEADRRESLAGEDVFDGVVLGEQPPVRVGVGG